MSRPAPLGVYIPALVVGLSVLNLIVTSLSILVDSITIWTLNSRALDVETHNWNAGVISGMILLAFHIGLTIVQIYFGVKLFNAVRERDHVKCKDWFYTSFNMYCVEFILFIFICLLAAHVDPFIAFTTLSLIYKLVQLWPVDGFIQNLESYSEPLLGGSAEFHI